MTKRPMFAKQTVPSDRIPMPGLCRDFGRDWEGNERAGGVERLDADDPHWHHLLKEGALAVVPQPPGADRFAPFPEFVGPVRRAFEAFGLAKDDEETWGRIKQNVDVIAQQYRRLISPGAIPKPSEIRTQLEDVEKAARNFAAALDALSEAALDWMLAFDPPAPLFPRSRAGGQSPGKAPTEFLRLLESALGPELAANAEILSKRPSLNEDQKRFAEAQAVLFMVKATAQGGEIIAEAQRRAGLLQAFGLMARPAPYPVRDRLAGKTRAIAALAKKARARAVEHGPLNPSNKSDRKVLGRTPGDWLIECCFDLIERAFGAEGLQKVKAYRKGNTNKEGATLFTDLLRAVEQYATGEKPSSFSEAVNQIARLRDERLGKPRVSRRRRKSAESTATRRR
jgi:hypothetical protein